MAIAFTVLTKRSVLAILGQNPNNHECQRLPNLITVHVMVLRLIVNTYYDVHDIENTCMLQCMSEF